MTVRGRAVNTNDWWRRLWVALTPALLIGVLIAGWEVYARSAGLGIDLLPAPSLVASNGWQERQALLRNLLPTVQATALGFTLSLTVGFLLSLLIDASRSVRTAILPVLVISQTLPLIVIAPVMVLWFGFGLLPKVLLIALITFFPITVSLVAGYAAADPATESLLRTMGASRRQILTSLRLPAALPSFFAGLRIAITYSVVAAIFAEYAGATRGLGVFMLTAKASFRTDLVLAAVIVSSVLTLLLFGLTSLIERATIPWWYQRRRTDGAA